MAMSPSLSPTGSPAHEHDYEHEHGKLHRLDTLPSEIIHLICSFLSDNLKDVRRLRLVCRRIGAIGACHALPEVVFWTHQADLAALRMMAHHPVYPRYVRTLIYMADVLDMERMSFEQYKGAYKEYRFARRKTERYSTTRMHPRHCSEGAVRNRAETSESLSSGEIRSSYREYKRVHAAQHEILDKNLDFHVVREAMAAFPNLENVLMSSNLRFRDGAAGTCCRFHCKIRSPFDSLFCDHQGYVSPEGVRNMQVLLQALEAAGHTSLKSLRAGTLYWQFFDGSYFNLKTMADLCANLTRFEIMVQSIPLDFGDWHVDDPEVEEQEIDKCRDLMRAGPIRKLLRRMPNLEHLSIMFSDLIDQPDFHYPASLRDIIPDDMTWPNLERVRLEAVEFALDEAMEFLLRHKDSLMCLYLKDIRLVGASVLTLLPRLKEDLETYLMQEVVIYGVIFGRDEDAMLASDEEEDWDLGDPRWNRVDMETGQEELTVAVSRYLMNQHEVECPLNRENMDLPF